MKEGKPRELYHCFWWPAKNSGNAFLRLNSVHMFELVSDTNVYKSSFDRTELSFVVLGFNF